MISIKNLTKEFSGQKVLDGIDIDIEKGEVVALVGASGAGKSTILRSLNYLEQPDSGTITIDDFKVDFETITKEQILTLRRKLAMVFQQFNLFERRTALDNVKEGLKIVKKLSDDEATKIASCGGYPKDINVYQMQKTMDNAACAVRKGGAVIMVAECVEGSGSAVLEEACRRLGSPQAIKAELEKDFRIGANKAYAVTRLMEKAKYYLVTALDRKMARDMLFSGAYDTIEEALASAEKEIGKVESVIVMPEGSLTVPRVEE